MNKGKTKLERSWELLVRGYLRKIPVFENLSYEIINHISKIIESCYVSIFKKVEKIISKAPDFASVLEKKFLYKDAKIFSLSITKETIIYFGLRLSSLEIYLVETFMNPLTCQYNSILARGLRTWCVVKFILNSQEQGVQKTTKVNFTFYIAEQCKEVIASIMILLPRKENELHCETTKQYDREQEDMFNALAREEFQVFEDRGNQHFPNENECSHLRYKAIAKYSCKEDEFKLIENNKFSVFEDHYKSCFLGCKKRDKSYFSDKSALNLIEKCFYNADDYISLAAHNLERKVNKSI